MPCRALKGSAASRHVTLLICRSPGEHAQHRHLGRPDQCDGRAWDPASRLASATTKGGATRAMYRRLATGRRSDTANGATCATAAKRAPLAGRVHSASDCTVARRRNTAPIADTSCNVHQYGIINTSAVAPIARRSGRSAASMRRPAGRQPAATPCAWRGASTLHSVRAASASITRTRPTCWTKSVASRASRKRARRHHHAARSGAIAHRLRTAAARTDQRQISARGRTSARSREPPHIATCLGAHQQRAVDRHVRPVSQADALEVRSAGQPARQTAARLTERRAPMTRLLPAG